MDSHPAPLPPDPPCCAWVAAAAAFAAGDGLGDSFGLGLGLWHWLPRSPSCRGVAASYFPAASRSRCGTDGGRNGNAVSMVGGEDRSFDRSQADLLPEHGVWKTEQRIARSKIVPVSEDGILQDPHHMHQHCMLAGWSSDPALVYATCDHDQHPAQSMISRHIRHQILASPLKPRNRLAWKTTKRLAQLLLRRLYHNFGMSTPSFDEPIYTHKASHSGCPWVAWEGIAYSIFSCLGSRAGSNAEQLFDRRAARS